MKILLTVNEVSQMLRIHPAHLRRLMGNKKIKFFKIPGVGVRFDPEDVQRMIEESTVEPIDWNEKGQELMK